MAHEFKVKVSRQGRTSLREACFWRAYVWVPTPAIPEIAKPAGAGWVSLPMAYETKKIAEQAGTDYVAAVQAGGI